MATNHKNAQEIPTIKHQKDIQLLLRSSYQSSHRRILQLFFPCSLFFNQNTPLACIPLPSISQASQGSQQRASPFPLHRNPLNPQSLHSILSLKIVATTIFISQYTGSSRPGSSTKYKAHQCLKQDHRRLQQARLLGLQDESKQVPTSGDHSSVETK